MSQFKTCLVASIVILTLLPFEAGGWGRWGDTSAEGGWMFSTAGRTSTGPGPSSRPASTSDAALAEPKLPRERPGQIFGYPTRQDPLFDDGTRLPYEHQHLQRQQWNRPRYGAALPQYVRPSLAQEPIRKPAYQEPLAVKPLDNKPRYTIENYLPPSVMKPSYEHPTYMDRPNYVIQPIEKPARDRPAYDGSGIFYNRPGYNPPVYTPEEYKPSRYAPSPFISPAK